jgi:hypothetical protein
MNDLGLVGRSVVMDERRGKFYSNTTIRKWTIKVMWEAEDPQGTPNPFIGHNLHQHKTPAVRRRKSADVSNSSAKWRLRADLVATGVAEL